jgi:hypothetical protein
MGALPSLYLRTMPRRSLIAALSLQQQLAHHVTQWDVRQARRRFYNPHALALYIKAADRAADMVADGLPLADALAYCFNDRLLAFLQRRMLPRPAAA